MSRAIEPVHEEAPEAEVEVEPNLGWLHSQVEALGRPFYHGHKDGTWTARVDVPTDRAGVTAEVHSGHGHATLSAALEALLERVRG